MKHGLDARGARDKMTSKIRFSKEALDELECPVGKADVMVYDTDGNGLAVRVTKAGSKTFFVVRKVKGKTHRVKLGAYDRRATKLPELRLRAATVFSSLEQTLSDADVKSKKDRITVSIAFEDMLKAKTKITAATVDDYRKTFKNYLTCFADRPLASITNDDVLRLHRDVTKPPVRKDGSTRRPRERAANKAVSLLGNIFSFAIAFYTDGDRRLFTHSPCEIMKTIKAWHTNPRAKIRVGPEELPALIEESLRIAENPAERDVPTAFQSASSAVLFMLFTGVRPGEIAKIKKEYVDHATRSIIFPARDQVSESEGLKNNKEFHLVLSDSAYCQLLHASKHSFSDYVFAGVERDQISESNVRDFLIKVGARIDKHLPRKILRSTFISVAEAAGVSSYQIKVLSNHSDAGQSVDVTDGYKSLYLSEVRAATCRVEDLIYELSKADKDRVCRGILKTLEPINERTMRSKTVSA